MMIPIRNRIEGHVGTILPTNPWFSPNSSWARYIWWFLVAAMSWAMSRAENIQALTVTFFCRSLLITCFFTFGSETHWETLGNVGEPWELGTLDFPTMLDWQWSAATAGGEYQFQKKGRLFPVVTCCLFDQFDQFDQFDPFDPFFQSETVGETVENLGQINLESMLNGTTILKPSGTSSMSIGPCQPCPWI